MQIAQLQGQLLAAQQVVAESLARGTHSRSASQASDPSNSCYDHWSGNRIFEADPGLSSAFGLYSGVFGPHHLVSNHSRRSSPASTGGADLPTWGQVGQHALPAAVLLAPTGIGMASRLL